VVVGDAAVAGGIVHLAAWLGWSAEQFATAADAAAAVATLGDRDALVVLDHGITATGPLLAVALAAGVGYVGALGSRATQARRAEHLRALGAPADAVARLHGPTGLDLGASSRAETALSICAEITASRTGRSARPLRDSSGPIQA
jgi:xanthine dehydrogenase accessory factor